jgi:hypothetical protein
MPMRVIAKKRCRAMFEPPEKGERATLNPNLSTRLNLFFRSGPWAAGWLLLVEEGERAALRSYGRCARMFGWGFHFAISRLGPTTSLSYKVRKCLAFS